MLAAVGFIDLHCMVSDKDPGDLMVPTQMIMKISILSLFFSCKNFLKKQYINIVKSSWSQF